VWIPGVTSTETIVFAAQHRYPYIALNTTEEDTRRIWKLYGDAAEASGYQAGEDLRGYLMRCHVQDDEDHAVANAHEFEWMQGEFTGMSKPWLISPAGYSSVESRLARLKMISQRRQWASAADLLKVELERGSMIAGTPKQAIERIRRWLEATRPSILLLWGNDGKIPHEDSMRCIQLLGEEVIPAVREIGDELGIHDPFQLDSPISLAVANGTGTPTGVDWARRVG
jgi:alkanesulfonate monooxygenase SsuD/methylene tetrahydromethanopterin reductase-like flavin-dependent oxidoreductase (luciferase family)